MVKAGIQGVDAVNFSVQSKEDMATMMRERMREGLVKIPYVPARKLGDIDLTAELNVERYELLKTGHVGFSHPQGTHDDVFWACALGISTAIKTPLAGIGAAFVKSEDKPRWRVQ